MKEIAIQWLANLSDLVDKRLLNQTPEDGTLGEIRYWKSMSGILDSIKKEITQPFVEKTLQVLQDQYPEFNKIREYIESLEQAQKEAYLNKICMVKIEPIVQTFLSADLEKKTDLLTKIMAALQKIYSKSKFYQEARIASFLR